MTHVRKQIRDAAVSALTGLTTTGARVYPSRLETITDADLPCLLVNTDDENIAGADVLDGVQERTLSLAIRACAKTTDNLDNLIDAMVSEVETALAGETLGGAAKMLQLTGVSIDMDNVIDRPVGIATITYSITYYTASGSPGTAL